ncbi:unnamed protein product [Adineta steineri]|uniref:Uncharacterized protein n=2 Tax=Adineta steineri TaxID=433720 RepID=A0A814R4L2_9BILA|nr:unnamed protein product [Adineta steineri]
MASQSAYKDSSDCPGNLKWNTKGITILGNDKKHGIRRDQLTFPEGLFIDSKTQILYVADAGNNYVLKRYPNGEIKIAAGQSNGASGSTSNKLNAPIDVFADEDENVYVADWNNQRIQLWAKDAKHGQTVAGNGTRGTLLNEFGYPSRVLVDSKKNIIVADWQNERITKWPPTYDPKQTTGTIIAGGNGAGLSPTQLYSPTGLYLDEPNNILYITNEQAHSVTQWNMDTYGTKSVYAGIPGRPGNSPVQLQSPEGITLDKYGNLYVTDCQNHRIQMFCPNSVFGITVAGTGQMGNGSNELYFPRDVALDADMNLYVTDTYNKRIQKFEIIH